MSTRDDGYDPGHDEPHDRRSWREGSGASRDLARQFDRLIEWLRERPTESWAFFIAGVVLAALFF